MTTVRAVARRQPLTFGAWTDLTGVDATSIQPLGDGWVQVTFPVDLTDEQITAVRDRLESTDDTDQAQRARVHDLMDQVRAMPTTPVRELMLLLAAGRLGETSTPTDGST